MIELKSDLLDNELEVLAQAKTDDDLHCLEAILMKVRLVRKP
jgi:hypothetical protein